MIVWEKFLDEERLVGVTAASFLQRPQPPPFASASEEEMPLSGLSHENNKIYIQVVTNVNCKVVVHVNRKVYYRINQMA